VGVRAGHRCDGACRGGLAPLVLGMRWQLRTRAVAALPGLATLVVAYVGTVDDASTRGDDFLVPSVLLAIEGSAVVAFLAIEAWQREVSGRVVLRLVVVLWGTTAFGFIHGPQISSP